jgi:hypothetical protein
MLGFYDSKQWAIREKRLGRFASEMHSVVVSVGYTLPDCKRNSEQTTDFTRKA